MKLLTALALLACLTIPACTTPPPPATPALLSPAQTASPSASPSSSPVPTSTVAPTPARPAFHPCTADADGGSVELWKCPFQPRSDFVVGGTVVDYLTMRYWNYYWKILNPLHVMKDNGFQMVRTLTTTVDAPLSANWIDSNWSSRDYTAKILKEARSLGYRLDLAFYLSDQAAHAGVQDAPPEWRGLSREETAAKLEEYTYQTTRFFQDQGLQIELYEIGNEIEWGILNFRPDERIPAGPSIDKTVDMAYMRNSVWNTEAFLLKAAIAGVKRADPQAAIVLHIDSVVYFPNDDISARAFFKTMLDEHVPFDYAGLSIYGSTPVAGRMSKAQFYARIQRLLDYLSGLGLPVLISEAGYPMDPSFKLESPMPDYPFSPEGQAEWIRDSLRFFSNNPDVHGYFYFYPDHFLHEDGADDAWGLFLDDRTPAPGMSEFDVNLYP